MTAYGKGQVDNEIGRILLELQSINRKHLEINLNLPRELTSFDPEIREWIKPYIARGQVLLKATLSQSAAIPKVSLNLPLIKEYKTACQQLSDYFKSASADSVFMQLILQQPQIFNFEVKEAGEGLRNLLKTAFDEAIAQFQSMRIQEGQALLIDLKKRLSLIEDSLEQILPIVEKAPKKYEEKLIKRLEEISANKEITDPRILMEVALFADKIDVSEEIIRFQSHLLQFYNFLNTDEPIGKTLEFLLQEMFREINTMNNKIGDVKGVQLCLGIKGELEKIREQIQNLE